MNPNPKRARPAGLAHVSGCNDRKRATSKSFSEESSCCTESLTDFSGWDFKAWKHSEVYLGLFLSPRKTQPAKSSARPVLSIQLGVFCEPEW